MISNDKFYIIISAKKFMINDVLKYSSSTALQYLYTIYKCQVFKPFSKWFFFKKNYEVICILNFKTTSKYLNDDVKEWIFNLSTTRGWCEE